MSFSTLHHNLSRPVSKNIVKSMIGSLNATCIAYTRGHLRYGQREMPTDRVPTIDDHNDEIAAINEAIERARVAGTMGFATQMPTPELIQKLMALRDYLVDRLMQMAERNNEAPLSIAETVKFQMSRQPDNNETYIDALVLALGDDVGITKEMMMAAQVKMTADDAADLRNNAGRIVDYLAQYDGVELNFDDEAVDACFESLPAHVQYKLMSAAIRAHDNATKKSMISLLRGKLDAAGDIKMLRANRTQLIAWLVAFSKQHANDLDAYVERGGTLMDIEDGEIITSNEPSASKSKMQRAPAPAPVA